MGLIVFGLALTNVSRAEDAPSWIVLIEPKFMKAPVTEPIAGAKKSELAAAILGEEGPAYLSREQFDALQVDWPAFFAKAQARGAAEVNALKIDFERDAKKVIIYATVRSEHGLMASAVLAPGFLDRFKDTMGEPLLVAIPNRYTAYVFPRLASRYLEYAPLVLRAYGATAYPVSTEVFELSKGAFKAVGAYRSP